MTTDPTRKRRKNRLGLAHYAPGPIRWVDVPAGQGVGAHRNAYRDTACGLEVMATLTTQRADLTRCPACLNAMPAAFGGRP